MTAPSYALTKTFPSMTFDETIDRVTEALKAEGFGIVTKLDMKETLKAKLGVNFKRYTVMGACNPPLAHKALLSEDHIGILLPCNVIVMEDEGKVTLSIAHAKELFRVVDNAKLDPIVDEIFERLSRVIDAL